MFYLAMDAEHIVEEQGCDLPRKERSEPTLESDGRIVARMRPGALSIIVLNRTIVQYVL
jgi:hypothetical protein